MINDELKNINWEYIKESWQSFIRLTPEEEENCRLAAIFNGRKQKTHNPRGIKGMPIIYIKTGQIFKSQNEAAAYFGVCAQTVSNWLKRGKRHLKPLRGNL